MVRALSEIRSGGRRSTSQALTLAAAQFPGTPVGRGVVLLYTTAPTRAASRRRPRRTVPARRAILVAVGTAG
jgi:hypothetical protein